jgi:hypothetical protein
MLVFSWIFFVKKIAKNKITQKIQKKNSEIFRKIVFSSFFAIGVPQPIWGMPAKIWGGLGPLV